MACSVTGSSTSIRLFRARFGVEAGLVKSFHGAGNSASQTDSAMLPLGINCEPSKRGMEPKGASAGGAVMGLTVRMGTPSR